MTTPEPPSLPPLPEPTVGLGSHRWAYGAADMRAYAVAALAARAPEPPSLTDRIERGIANLRNPDTSDIDPELLTRVTEALASRAEPPSLRDIRFEEWAKDNVSYPSFSGYHGTLGLWFYNHRFMQAHWICWRAALASRAEPPVSPLPVDLTERSGEAVQRAVGELPPLPRTPYLSTVWSTPTEGVSNPFYTAKQMREYARSAIAASGNPATARSDEQRSLKADLEDLHDAAITAGIDALCLELKKRICVAAELSEHEKVVPWADVKIALSICTPESEAPAPQSEPDRFEPKDEALIRTALVYLSNNKDHDQETRNRAYALFQVLRQEVAAVPQSEPLPVAAAYGGYPRRPRFCRIKSSGEVTLSEHDLELKTGDELFERFSAVAAQDAPELVGTLVVGADRTYRFDAIKGKLPSIGEHPLYAATVGGTP